MPALAAGNTVVVKPSELTPYATGALHGARPRGRHPAGRRQRAARHGRGRRGARPPPPRAEDQLHRRSDRRPHDPRHLRRDAEAGGARARAASRRASCSPTPTSTPSRSSPPPRSTRPWPARAVRSATRLVVHDSVYDELAEKVVAFTRDITLGDPFDPATGMGPVVSRAAQERILGMIERASERRHGQAARRRRRPGRRPRRRLLRRADGVRRRRPGQRARPGRGVRPGAVAHAVRRPRRRRCRSPTAPPTAWPRTSGPTTWPGSTASCRGSRPAASTSTAPRR